MPRTAAKVTQADVARMIRAARQAGAVEVEVRGDGGQVIGVVRFTSSTAPQEATEPEREIII